MEQNVICLTHWGLEEMQDILKCIFLKEKFCLFI